MKEKDLLNWITDVARRFGWRVFHVPAPMRAARAGGFVGAKEAAGLPDLFLLASDPPRMIIAEIKGDGGKLSDAQRDFLTLARDAAETTARIEVYAWTPSDRDVIEGILQSRVLI